MMARSTTGESDVHDLGALESASIELTFFNVDESCSFDCDFLSSYNLLGRFRTFQSIKNYFRMDPDTLKHSRTFWNILEHSRTFWNILEHFGIF